MECTRCGEELNDEEIESPRKDYDDEPICDQCYDDCYSFVCCLCEEHEDLDEQGELGNLLVVATDGDPIGIPDGIYEVVSHPYYWDSMIDGGIYDNSLKRLSIRIKRDLYMCGYPIAHMCDFCSNKTKKKATEILLKKF